MVVVKSVCTLVRCALQRALGAGSSLAWPLYRQHKIAGWVATEKGWQGELYCFSSSLGMRWLTRLFHEFGIFYFDMKSIGGSAGSDDGSTKA